MKDVVIIADFCGSFDGKGNNRFVYIAEQLIKRGHNVEIITSDYSHGNKKQFEPIVENYNGIKVTMLHEFPYSKNVSIKRFVSHYFWGKRVGKYLKNRKKPDVVYCAMPTLKAASVAGKFCSKNDVKFIIDVQDLWPEAYKMVFDVPILSSIIFAPFKSIANSAYRRADEIVAVSQTYVDRAMKVNKTAKEGRSVFLGTDLKAFDRNVAETEPIKKEPGEIWLGYCGTLGASYALKTVFDAIKLLNNPTLRFVIMGDGPQKKELENYSGGLNVLFTGRLPYKDMCGVLSECDIVINPIKDGSAASIINKHADYAASGKSIINTQESQEYRDLVEKYGMGINVRNKPEQVAEAIGAMVREPNNRLRMGLNARKCARELFDRQKTYAEIIKLIVG